MVTGSGELIGAMPLSRLGAVCWPVEVELCAAAEPTMAKAKTVRVMRCFKVIPGDEGRGERVALTYITPKRMMDGDK
jgi:hypothetical protein